jgi:hypothetical protein
MNERIRELAEQAGFNFRVDCATDDEIVRIYKTADKVEKLAELIVLEMCNVLDKEQWNIGRDWICDDGTRIIPKVKEHFGVE